MLKIILGVTQHPVKSLPMLQKCHLNGDMSKLLKQEVHKLKGVFPEFAKTGPPSCCSDKHLTKLTQTFEVWRRDPSEFQSVHSLKCNFHRHIFSTFHSAIIHHTEMLSEIVHDKPTSQKHIAYTQLHEWRKCGQYHSRF